MIDQQIAALLHDGVGIHLGTRNEQLEPNGARALALRVENDGRRVVVYMARAGADRVLPDLQANGSAAVVVGRPTDERSCQVKGRFEGVRPVTPDEHAYVHRQWNAFLDNLEHIGIPRLASSTWASTADVAIAIRVTELFDQTPGPGAGKALS